MSVATIIYQQLGGKRFSVMTGAKNLMSDEDTLYFDLPSRFAKDGINMVKITLDASDTYTMRFSKMWGMKMKVIATVSDVYADNLQRVFTMHTGLDTHL